MDIGIYLFIAPTCPYTLYTDACPQNICTSLSIHITFALHIYIPLSCRSRSLSAHLQMDLSFYTYTPLSACICR